MFYTDAIKDLESKTNIQEMQEGEYRITKPCVCESAAGFYIGTWCIEKMDNRFFPQPYERQSGYMSRDEAEKTLGYYKRLWGI